MNVNYYAVENGTAQLNTTYPTYATDFLKTVDNIAIEAYVDDPASCSELGPGSIGNTGLVEIGYANETQGYSVLITVRGGELVATRIIYPETLAKSELGFPSLG